MQLRLDLAALPGLHFQVYRGALYRGALLQVGSTFAGSTFAGSTLQVALCRKLGNRSASECHVAYRRESHLLRYATDGLGVSLAAAPRRRDTTSPSEASSAGRGQRHRGNGTVVEYHSQTSTTRSKQERERASSTRRGQHIPMAYPAGTLTLFAKYTHAHLRISKHQ